MGLTKPIEQYLFSNLLTKIHIVVYLKDIIRGDIRNEKRKHITESTRTNFWISGRKRKVRCKVETTP